MEAWEVERQIAQAKKSRVQISPLAKKCKYQADTFSALNHHKLMTDNLEAKPV